MRPRQTGLRQFDSVSLSKDRGSAALAGLLSDPQANGVKAPAKSKASNVVEPQFRPGDRVAIDWQSQLHRRQPDHSAIIGDAVVTVEGVLPGAASAYAVVVLPNGDKALVAESRLKPAP